MKKTIYYLFFVSFVMFFLVSCSKDDNDDNSVNSALVGIWTQYHTGTGTNWYLGFKLDIDGQAAYTEWDYKRTPDWGYMSGAKWIANDGVLTIYNPVGNIEYSSHYFLSSDGQTITLAADIYEGHFGTLKGDFKKNN